jgi:hypothetical protein
LKYLRLDLHSARKKYIQKGHTQAEGVESVYKLVEKKVENLVGPLLTPELKLIWNALDKRWRINRCFDLLGIVYPDWPLVDASGSEVDGKRKRCSTSKKYGGAPKQGRGCRGQGSSSERLVVAKVS